MEIMASISSSAHHHNSTFGPFCASPSSSPSFRFSRHHPRPRSSTKTLLRNGRGDLCRIPRFRDTISRSTSINYSLGFRCCYYTETSNERYEDNLYGDHIPSHNLEVLTEIRRNTSSSMRRVAGRRLPFDGYNKKNALATWSKETEILRLAKQNIHGNGGARCQVNGNTSNYSAKVSPHYSKFACGISVDTDFDENKIPLLPSGPPFQDPLEHSCNASTVVENAASEITRDKSITQVNGNSNSYEITVADSPRSVKSRPKISMHPRNISKAVRTSRLEDISRDPVKISHSLPSLKDQAKRVSVPELDANEVKLAETVISPRKSDIKNIQDELMKIYNEVLIVDDISVAKDIVRMLTHEYKHLIHACDTEVAKIDVKQETPVDHGEITCFSIYSGPNADFGHGKSCIWVDVLDGGGKDLLLEFGPFFEDPSIKKVWHNYSFDNHVIENYGIKLSGFHADTMHMARLWDSSRRTEGGYSLEALTGDHKVMAGAKLGQEKEVLGKISMKTIFGKKKLKKDGSEGKMITLAPVEELQREERELWICYSALDAISTLKLYESLRNKLLMMAWKFEGTALPGKSMFDFYREYWRPFGRILVKMESEGMLVDRDYLAKIEKQAKAEQEIAVNRFRNWASKYCPDAKYMNVGSDTQLRQLLFGGTLNRKDQNESLPVKKVFKVPNTDGFIEEGKKTALKYRNITLHCITDTPLPTEMYTATGWPSVSGDALKILAGKVSAEYDFQDEFLNPDSVDNDEETHELNIKKVSRSPESTGSQNVDISAYGAAYRAFRNEEAGREACHAIAALCEVCSIDSLISNFILPLQGYNVSGKNSRVHCSLNINTETGRLSARRPNLQNQPALEKDRYKIRQAFIAAPGNSLIVADYGQLELRILAHLADCKSMLEAFEAGGDFHSRTALNMYQYIQDAVEKKEVLLEWHPQPGEDKPPVPLIKDAFGSERRKAKMLNFSIAYGKTPIGLARDWKVSVEEARETVDLWYKERQEVLIWQENRKAEARRDYQVHTLLGRARKFPSLSRATHALRSHIERAAINTPVQGSAADVAMCAMLEISKNKQLKEMGWRLLLQVHDEVILEGPKETAEIAEAIVVECMSKPFNGKNFLKVDLAVDAKCAQNWYAAK